MSAVGGIENGAPPLMTPFGEAGENRRHVERFEGGCVRRKQADAGRNGAALVLNIGAAASAVGAHEAEIERAFQLEVAAALLRG
jgi:hypothetical protein